jgi:transposase
MLKYKAELAGIKVVITEESYTSKCSFFDMEPIYKHEKYKGRRIKRGLFKASNGRLINADVNGSLNIIRKAFGNEAFASDSIQGLVVSPVRVTPYKQGV